MLSFIICKTIGHTVCYFKKFEKYPDERSAEEMDTPKYTGNPVEARSFPTALAAEQLRLELVEYTEKNRQQAGAEFMLVEMRVKLNPIKLVIQPLLTERAADLSGRGTIA